MSCVRGRRSVVTQITADPQSPIYLEESVRLPYNRQVKI
jgi:hypothetical protein